MLVKKYANLAWRGKDHAQDCHDLAQHLDNTPAFVAEQMMLQQQKGKKQDDDRRSDQPAFHIQSFSKRLGINLATHLAKHSAAFTRHTDHVHRS
jgi:hypothetical protein